MQQKSYSEQIDLENTERLRELMKELPPYAKDYFRGITPRTQSRTRLAYAYDLSVFFRYLHENNPVLGKKEIREITLEDLEALTPLDLEEYLDYLQVYQDHTNKELGLKRKLASLKSFYKYFIYLEAIKYNPAELVRMPKVHEKAIVRLDIDEVAEFLDQVDSGEKLTDRQQAFHQRTRLRDLAMMSLMLGTGIRVSELCNLNIDDINRNTMTIHVMRKGGKEEDVLINDVVRKAIDRYIDFERQPYDDANRALFLSSRHATGDRLSVRSVERMIKAYGDTIGEHVTPHTLRRTFGTKLYNQTGDLYLTATALGHKNIQTTKDFYTTMSEERKQLIRGINYEETNKSEENKGD